MYNDKLVLTALQKAFPGIPDTEADDLLDVGEVVQYMSGKVLCTEGAVEDIFYILLDGKVKVTKVINDQEDRFLKHLIPGDFFGEMGIIHNAPRAASVATTENSTVLEINKEAFERALEESSTLSMAMVREVSRRLRENDDLAIEDLRVKAGELAEAYQQLAELEMARSEFLTTIAHELRTPLASAGGFMQLIFSGALENDALYSGLETVARNIEQITALINDILFLQEMDLILADFEPLEIGTMINSVIESEGPYAVEAGVTLAVTIAPNLPPILGDSKSLQRAFGALVNNAIKFSPEGSEVAVKIGQNPDNVWVSVTDQGVGIEPDDMNKIYDRFHHMDEFEGKLYGGVGLGLSIARQVIQQHMGTIDVQSRLRHGSVFTVKLNLGAQSQQTDGE